MMSDYTNRKKISELTWEQKRFVAKRIVKDVERIAKEENISPEVAYWFYVHKVYE